MVAVRINGEEAQLRVDGVPNFASLIELVKASIDPEHMITDVMIDGRVLSEQDWRAPMHQLGTAIVEIETGTPESFWKSRLGAASDVVRSCYIEFRDARKAFQSGNMQEGNKMLVTATNTLRAFFEWYGTMLELVPAEQRPQYDLGSRTSEIMAICKSICGHQLYQSWWALGEALEKELEPMLDELETFCRSFATAA